VSVFLVFVILFTFSARADATRRRITEKMRKLEEAKVLAAGYSEAEASRKAAEQRLSTSDVRLITFLEEKGTESGLELPALNPRGDVPVGDGRIIESSVGLDFTDIPLARLTSFLERVERGPGVVKVKYLRLEPRPSEEKISASLTISAYHLKQP
jgi:general secretion pathway protein M